MADTPKFLTASEKDVAETEKEIASPRGIAERESVETTAESKNQKISGDKENVPPPTPLSCTFPGTEVLSYHHHPEKVFNSEQKIVTSTTKAFSKAKEEGTTTTLAGEAEHFSASAGEIADSKRNCNSASSQPSRSSQHEEISQQESNENSRGTDWESHNCSANSQESHNEICPQLLMGSNNSSQQQSGTGLRGGLINSSTMTSSSQTCAGRLSPVPKIAKWQEKIADRKVPVDYTVSIGLHGSLGTPTDRRGGGRTHRDRNSQVLDTDRESEALGTEFSTTTTTARGEFNSGILSSRGGSSRNFPNPNLMINPAVGVLPTTTNRSQRQLENLLFNKENGGSHGVYNFPTNDANFHQASQAVLSASSASSSASSSSKNVEKLLEQASQRLQSNTPRSPRDWSTTTPRGKIGIHNSNIGTQSQENPNLTPNNSHHREQNLTPNSRRQNQSLTQQNHPLHVSSTHLGNNLKHISDSRNMSSSISPRTPRLVSGSFSDARTPPPLYHRPNLQFLHGLQIL